MSSVNVEYTGSTFTLTDEHSASPYGQLVLVGPDGTVYLPWDVAVTRGNWATTARAVASYIRDDRPDDADAIGLLERFCRIPEPH